MATVSPSPANPKKRFRIFSSTKLTFLLPVFLFLLLSGWAVSSPIGSSPDDDYHLTSIWCAGGSQESHCLFLNDTQVAVPKKVGAPQYCYAFKTNTSAECVQETEDSLTVSNRENTIQKLYPTTYYKTFHIFSALPVEQAVLVIRFLNAALASLILFSVLKIAPQGVRVPFIIAYSLGIVPLGLFIIPSTNPSSWALLGVSAFWAYGATLLWRDNSIRDPKTILLLLLAAVAGFLAIGSRPDSMIYISVAAVLAALYVGVPQIKKNLVPLLYLVGLCLVGAYFFLNTRTPGADEIMGIHEQNIQLLVSNLFQIPSLYEGIMGGWALGWNDTPMYNIVSFVGVLLLGGLVYLSFQEVSLQKTLSILVSVSACLVFPLYFLQVEGLRVGEVVQPRYLIPLFFLLLMALAAGKTPNTSVILQRNYIIFYSTALIVTAFLSFASHLHRYTFGGSPGFPIGQWDSSWDPMMLNTPLLLVFVGVCTVSFFGSVGMFLRTTTSLQEENTNISRDALT
jgi:hypothetical protein